MEPMDFAVVWVLGIVVGIIIGIIGFSIASNGAQEIVHPDILHEICQEKLNNTNAHWVDTQGKETQIECRVNEIYEKDRKQYLYILNKYFPYYMARKEQIDIAIENESLSFDIKIETRDNSKAE